MDLLKLADNLTISCSMYVSDFLLKNGGLHNGYSTTVDGEIIDKYNHYVRWVTPTFINLTGKEVACLSAELCDKLLILKIKSGLENCIINLTNTHIENGCYVNNVEVTISTSREVKLN